MHDTDVWWIDMNSVGVVEVIKSEQEISNSLRNQLASRKVKNGFNRGEGMKETLKTFDALQAWPQLFKN